jgi:hypothetical protein
MEVTSFRTMGIEDPMGIEDQMGEDGDRIMETEITVETTKIDDQI